MLASECEPVLARLQSALDGAGSLPDAHELHPSICRNCRERISAAHLIMPHLGYTGAFSPLPLSWTNRIVGSVIAERKSRLRQRITLAVGSFSLAAAGLLAVRFWPLAQAPNQPEIVSTIPQLTNTISENPPPTRVGVNLDQAYAAMRGTSNAIIDPVTPIPSPRFAAAASDVLSASHIGPLGGDLKPVSWSLTEVPEAARRGIEPVTGTAQKALSRLRDDVASLHAAAKPKS